MNLARIFLIQRGVAKLQGLLWHPSSSHCHYNWLATAHRKLSSHWCSDGSKMVNTQTAEMTSDRVSLMAAHNARTSTESGGRTNMVLPEVGSGNPLKNKLTWCLTSTETIRLIRDEEKGGRGYGGGERGRLYTYSYTVTTRMTPALRWAAMRAILKCH